MVGCEGQLVMLYQQNLLYPAEVSKNVTNQIEVTLLFIEQ